MKIVFTSLKGGVGKTGLAINLSDYTDSLYVTNDLSSLDHPHAIHIESNKKRIPDHLTEIPDVVFDFGAMSTKIDPKLTQVLKLCDVIVIPTRPDPRSIAATIETFHFVRDAGKPIVVIINHVRDERKYEWARKTLIQALGVIPVFKIRETTLFDRVSIDGIDWYKNIHHKKGEYQLNKTRLAHEAVYDAIIAIGKKA